MRSIKLYLQDSSCVELFDDSDIELEEYCKEISNIFNTTNISILSSSESVFICRPSQLIGIEIKDIEIIEEPKVPTPKIIEQDIITDMD